MNLINIYNLICERGKSRVLKTYTEKHHIVPSCMGGDNSKQNLTRLTAREHFLCHKILCHIYPENEKLKFAFWAMCNQTKYRNYMVSSRDYEYAKLLCLEFWKRPKTKEHTLKLKEGILKEGYIEGRKPKLPFIENKIEKNIFIRKFNKNTDEKLLQWHWDDEDRIVEVIGTTDWKFQFDNELPIDMNGTKLFVEKKRWHRVIKGSQDIFVKIIKLK